VELKSHDFMYRHPRETTLAGLSMGFEIVARPGANRRVEGWTGSPKSREKQLPDLSSVHVGSPASNGPDNTKRLHSFSRFWTLFIGSEFRNRRRAHKLLLCTL
jgi:hypothetical protein